MVKIRFLSSIALKIKKNILQYLSFAPLGTVLQWKIAQWLKSIVLGWPDNNNDQRHDWRQICLIIMKIN